MASGIRRITWRRRPVLGRALAVAAILAVVAAAAPIWAAQRTPYAKNGSDWNEIAQVIESRTQPGDAIVFDDAVRPSRRPRLAMDTDPAAFAAVRDVTLASPYRDNPTWHDIAMTVDAAAREGRFRGVKRVWVVEYRIGTAADAWGLASLRRLGYHEVQRTVEHRSVVALYADR
jgi:mannosyltransferase